MGRPLRTWAFAIAGLWAAAGAPGGAVAGPTPVASINVGSADGTPGSFVPINVTLELLTTPPNDVVGTSNDFSFPRHTPIVVSAGGGYVDNGKGHIARNETGALAVDVSVIMAPVGAAFRSELDAPGPNCGF